MEVGPQVVARLDGGVARDGQRPLEVDLHDEGAGTNAGQVTTGCGG
jgi:hypothetical protein